VTDAQVGHEKTLTGLIAALAGANMIYGLGMLESGIVFDYGQLVLDCEYARMIKQVVNGFTVDDEGLAREVIREVGPFGHFLVHPHTRQHMRIHSQPEFIDRRARTKWEAAGSPSIREKALQKARYILEHHHPAPLPDSVLGSLAEIVRESEREMGIRV